MEEIIVFPVKNNPNGEYALQEVGGKIAGTYFGLLFIGIFAIAPFVAIIGADWLGIILAIGIGYTIWCFIRTWDSWKK